MRDIVFKNRQQDSRINYRGSNPGRLENLTDAVFGIAITLLIFNLSNPNSFSDLLTFTKTLPAFILSIAFIFVIWNEHVRFSEIYTLNDTWLSVLNTLFIALVIFLVYPLRFITLFLTNFFFSSDISLRIDGHQVPDLMIYYGFILSGLYLVLFLFYKRAHGLKNEMDFNPFEQFYTSAQLKRLVMMISVPLLSILFTIFLRGYSSFWASLIGGITYFLYSPAIFFWLRSYHKKAAGFL